MLECNENICFTWHQRYLLLPQMGVMVMNNLLRGVNSLLPVLGDNLTSDMRSVWTFSKNSVIFFLWIWIYFWALLDRFLYILGEISIQHIVRIPEIPKLSQLEQKTCKTIRGFLANTEKLITSAYIITSVTFLSCINGVKLMSYYCNTYEKMCITFEPFLSIWLVTFSCLSKYRWKMHLKNWPLRFSIIPLRSSDSLLR